MRYACDFCGQPIHGGYYILSQMIQLPANYSVSEAKDEQAFCDSDCVVAWIKNGFRGGEKCRLKKTSLN